MAITGTAFGELLIVGAVPFSIEHSTRGSILCHAVASEVFEMRAERDALDPMPYDPRLDHRTTRPIGEPPCGREACRPAAAERTAPHTVA